jgi:hypothetical protein
VENLFARPKAMDESQGDAANRRNVLAAHARYRTCSTGLTTRASKGKSSNNVFDAKDYGAGAVRGGWARGGHGRRAIMNPADAGKSIDEGSNRRRRRLFVTTKTELNAIAAPAMSGLSKPNAASGSAATL